MCVRILLGKMRDPTRQILYFPKQMGRALKSKWERGAKEMGDLKNRGKLYKSLEIGEG